MIAYNFLFIIFFLLFNVVFFALNITEYFYVNVLLVIQFFTIFFLLTKHIKGKPNLAFSNIIVFNYLFFFISPLLQINTIQYNNFQFPNTLVFELTLVYKALISIILFNLIFVLIYFKLEKLKISKTGYQLDNENINEFYKGYNFSSYCILIFCILILPFFFSYFFESGQKNFPQSTDLIIRKFLFFLPIFPAIFFLINKNRVSFLILLFSILLMFFFKNPFVEKRHALGPIYLLFISFYFTGILNSNLKSILTVFFILLAGFPLVSIITHNPDIRYNFIFSEILNFNFVELFLNIFTKTLHYDAFSNLMGAIKYYEVNNPKIGYQLIGTIFFFVPRAYWIDKPLSSGEEVANFLMNKYSLWFNNLSQPLVGEGWINFGILGVIFFAIFFAYFVFYFSKWNENKDLLKKIFYVYFSYHLIFFLRGDLMNGIAYLVGPYLAIYITPKLLGKISKTKDYS